MTSVLILCSSCHKAVTECICATVTATRMPPDALTSDDWDHIVIALEMRIYDLKSQPDTDWSGRKRGDGHLKLACKVEAVLAKVRSMRA